MGEWHEVKESERPAYVKSRARNIISGYGGELDNPCEVWDVMYLLCNLWGWTLPEEYIGNRPGPREDDA